MYVYGNQTSNLMLKNLTDAFASPEFIPIWLLVAGAMIGYFRQQHTQSKVPGALSVPKDLLKTTEFNKLWTLLYVFLLPLAYILNVFVYAVYGLMWLVNLVGIVVRWIADKLHWLWTQLILGLGVFSFSVLWHYVMVWPYRLFSKILSTFFESFNWEANKASYKKVVLAVIIAVSGFVLDDIFTFELFDFSEITIIAGLLLLLDAFGMHIAKAMGLEAKGMRPTYSALIITAIVVYLAEYFAQDFLLLNQAAGLLGGVVLGVSVVTWLYGVIIAAAAVQFLSLIIPAYLKNDGPFNWLKALRDSFRSRWLKSLGSILVFALAYNTIGMWIYDKVQQVTAMPYNEYISAIDERLEENEVALKKAQENLSSALSADTINADSLSIAYADIRSIKAGNTFWSAVPDTLRDIVFMEINKPFQTTEKDVESLNAGLDAFKIEMEAEIAVLDSTIDYTKGELEIAVARRNRVNSSGITASEDNSIENGTGLRFGMPIPEDASSLKWRITDAEGDTISSRNGGVISYRFTSGNYTVFAAPINGCGSGTWSSYSVSVNEVPTVPASMGGVSGPTEVCVGKEYTYTTRKGMEFYSWSVPAGVEILSDNDQNSIKVKWGKTSGEISVKGEKDGEISVPSRLYISATGAPGVVVNDEGKTAEPSKPEPVSLKYYPVTLEEANVDVDKAQDKVYFAEAAKETYVFNTTNELIALEEFVQNAASEFSGNSTTWILNMLGKLLLLVTMSFLLGILLNFMVVWSSKYFGGLYDMDQDGATYFKSTLTEYKSKYDGFPYLGLFIIAVLFAVTTYLGFDQYMEYLGQFIEHLKQIKGLIEEGVSLPSLIDKMG